MSDHSRFAVYYVPAPGTLADFGAAWLGWDSQRSLTAAQPEVAEIEEITATPRKYGFHATLKPPFRLAQGHTQSGLAVAVQTLARQLAPASADSLELARFGRFLALKPIGDTSGIARVAAACVTELDDFRAPPTEAELERRSKAGLSNRQKDNLARWGYPYVLDDFRFHMTLTGRLAPDRIDGTMAVLQALLPPLPAPFELDAIALLAERQDGRFEMLHRYALTC